MNEYDRWYRSYRRRQLFIEAFGYIVAGVVVAVVTFAMLCLMLVAFG